MTILFRCLLYILFFFFPLSNCLAQGGAFGVSLSTATQEFSNHSNKESSTLTGVSLEFHYMDLLDLKIVHSDNSTLFSIPEIEDGSDPISLGLTQNGIALTLHKYTDLLDGNWTGEVQYNQIKGSLSDPQLGDVEVLGLGARYENYSGSIFVDFNYTESDYLLAPTIRQWDYAAGMMFVPSKAWVQARQYLISSSEQTEYSAIEFLLQYWLTTEWLLSADEMFVSYSFGDRKLFYDTESMVLWNSRDLLKNYLKLGVSWELPYRSKLLLVGAQAEYYNLSEEYSYESQMLYLELQKYF